MSAQRVHGNSDILAATGKAGMQARAGAKFWTWRRIVLTFPIAVVDRPGSTLSFLSSVVAKTFDYARIDEGDAPILARLRAPAWTFIHGPRSLLSSTALREANTR